MIKTGIKISVRVQQLNIIQPIEVYSYQKGANIVQLLFNKLNFNNELRNSVQSTLKVENVEVDINKTINDLKIDSSSLVEVVLSKKIKIECDHEYLGLIQYNTDVFDSVDLFRFHLINNFIQINKCEIVIINQEDGTKFGNDSWGKYGSFQNTKVGIQITNQQEIIYNQVNKVMKIDIFQPVAKLIHQFMNEQNIKDEIIAFKYQQRQINPDDIYKNLNIPQEQPLEVEIRNDFIFKIVLEQQQVQEITVSQNMEVLELMGIIRSKFQIENTIPLKLEYKLKKYILDNTNTIKQECIPIYSQLNLIKEPSDNKINTQSLNQQINIQQQEIVDVNSTDKFEEKQQIHEPSDDISQITITFQNMTTKISKQITIQSTCAIMDGLQEVIKTEAINDINYYQVYLGQQKLDIKQRFDKLNIISNSQLTFFTDYVIFQAFVQGQNKDLIVDQNWSISDIEKKFKQFHKIKQELSLQMMKPQNKNESLKQFLIKNKAFPFIFVVLSDIYIQEQLIELCILLKELGSQTLLKMKQNETVMAIFQEIKIRYQLPNNQVLKLFIGERIVKENEFIYEIKKESIQSKNQMRVQFIYFLTLKFVSSDGKEQIVQAKLEDTLQDTLINNQIYGDNFSFQNQLLNIKQKIKNLPIENNTIIMYQSQQILMNFKNSKTGIQNTIIVSPDETFQNIINKLGVRINELKYQNQILDLTSKIKSIQYNPNENITYEEQQTYHEPSENFSQPYIIQVTIIIGDKRFIYNVNSDMQINLIKQDVHRQMQNGTDISKYALTYQGNLIDEQKIISSFGNEDIEFQYILVVPKSQS